MLINYPLQHRRPLYLALLVLTWLLSITSENFLQASCKKMDGKYKFAKWSNHLALFNKQHQEAKPVYSKIRMGKATLAILNQRVNKAATPVQKLAEILTYMDRYSSRNTSWIRQLMTIPNWQVAAGSWLDHPIRLKRTIPFFEFQTWYLKAQNQKILLRTRPKLSNEDLSQMVFQMANILANMRLDGISTLPWNNLWKSYEKNMQQSRNDLMFMAKIVKQSQATLSQPMHFEINKAYTANHQWVWWRDNLQRSVSIFLATGMILGLVKVLYNAEEHIIEGQMVSQLDLTEISKNVTTNDHCPIIASFIRVHKKRIQDFVSEGIAPDEPDPDPLYLRQKEQLAVKLQIFSERACDLSLLKM